MDFQKLLVLVVKILDDFSIPYAVTGGYAVSIWGRVRATYDIDVVIELFPPKVKPLREALRRISDAAYIEEAAMLEAIEQQGEFNFIHPESGIKIDFFVKGKDAVSKLELERRIPIDIDGHKIYFISPEDLILSKLRWHNTSGSERQLEDVKSVLKIQKKLDWKYLKKWTRIQLTDEILKPLITKNL